MAKIKTSALVADIKGTVGGNVFASNKGGNYVRRYKKPTNANTTKQQLVRDVFGAMAGLWRGLTEIQRQSWIEGAVNFPYQDTLGETRIYSGQQLFNKLNNNLRQINASFLTTCPIPQSILAFSSISVDNIDTGNVLTLGMRIGAANAVPSDCKLVIQGTTSMSQGISAPQQGLFKKIDVVSNGGSTVSVDLSTLYNDNFGTLITGDTIFIQFFLISLVSGESGARTFVKSTRISV